MEQGTTVALIVAAGRGERSGQALPKQFARVGGKAMVAHSHRALAAHPGIDRVVVVIGAGQRNLLGDALGAVEWVEGGATRRDSVRRGLEYLAGGDVSRVLIHDAARPFVPAAVVDRLVAALDRDAGAVPALPVADTLARGAASARPTSTVAPSPFVSSPSTALRAGAQDKLPPLAEVEKREPSARERFSTSLETNGVGKGERLTALVVAGGVAANRTIRAALEHLAAEHGLRFVAPPLWLCTDNAAMIGWAGAERFAAGLTDPLDVAARPRWPLDPTAEKARGAGVKA